MAELNYFSESERVITYQSACATYVDHGFPVAPREGRQKHSLIYFLKSPIDGEPKQIENEFLYESYSLSLKQLGLSNVDHQLVFVRYFL